MRTKHLTLILALILPVAACETTPATTALNQTDTDFVNTAYNLMQLDDQEGQLAAVQAADPRVKAIAGELIDKTEQLDPQVYQVIGAENITPPSRLSDQSQGEVTALTPLTGKAFDQAYLKDQIDSHKRGVAMFQAEQARTQDPQLRQLAATALPIVQDDLNKLQAIAATL